MMQSFEANLSPIERQFFKLYTIAAKRDFQLLQTALHLMHPQSLSVHCPVYASRAAAELQEMYENFDEKINQLVVKHKLPRKLTHTPPTMDELVSLVSASFFNLVATVKTSPKDHGAAKSAGWFSGETENWQKNIASLKKITAKTEHDKKNVSPLVAAMLQLFNSLVNTKFPFMIDYQKSFFVDYQQKEEEEWDDDIDNSAPEDFD